METSLRPEHIRPVVKRLSVAKREISSRRPGDLRRRQPVHVMYGGAHLFTADTIRQLGDLALRSLDTHAPDFVTFARVFDLPGASELPDAPHETEALAVQCRENFGWVRENDFSAWLAHTVYNRVREKLEREPIEDFRIDFEDRYGYRPNAEEDKHAVMAARETAQSIVVGSMPPYFGLRVKPFAGETWVRALRTLDIFVTTLVQETRGRLPENFVVALPKVTHPEEGAALADILSQLEKALRLRAGAIQVEVMIETPQILISPDGRSGIPALARAVGPRFRGAHFGAFDYSATLNISAADHSMVHEACDFARLMMQNALAGTGVWIADGVTKSMPGSPDEADEGELDLTEREHEEDHEAVWSAWKAHYDNVRHALAQGIYKGLDLHPAQLPARYAATHATFLREIESSSERLTTFVDMAADANRSGAVFDDAAAGQGLLNHLLRAIDCGAITREEAAELTGFSVEGLRSRSFEKILNRRTRGERVRRVIVKKPEAPREREPVDEPDDFDEPEAFELPEDFEERNALWEREHLGEREDLTRPEPFEDTDRFDEPAPIQDTEMRGADRDAEVDRGEPDAGSNDEIEWGVLDNDSPERSHPPSSRSMSGM
jgi:hypothetical protein